MKMDFFSYWIKTNFYTQALWLHITDYSTCECFPHCLESVLDHFRSQQRTFFKTFHMYRWSDELNWLILHLQASASHLGTGSGLACYSSNSLSASGIGKHQKDDTKLWDPELCGEPGGSSWLMDLGMLSGCLCGCLENSFSPSFCRSAFPMKILKNNF